MNSYFRENSNDTFLFNASFGCHFDVILKRNPLLQFSLELNNFYLLATMRNNFYVEAQKHYIYQNRV